jgi:hypothetical protein
MMNEVSDKLLEDIKNNIDRTWKDDAADKKLSGIILRGCNRINDICGCEFDYEQENTAKELLISYVMYALAGALDDWQKNYSQDINRLQLIQEVKAYADREASEQGTV